MLSILTNAEAWYGLSAQHVEQLEVVDPIEGIKLELGIYSIGTIIKARRVIFLHNVLSTSDNEMNQKVLMAQWNNPTKDDWTEQVKLDLKDFQIEADLIKITKKSQNYLRIMLK